MDLLRVAGATLNQTPLDFAGNASRIIKHLQTARALGVELLCLPELCVTGYGCEDAFFSLATVQQAEAALATILPETQGLTVLLGLPHFFEGALYNCAVMVQDAAVLGVNAKRVLPREGVHYEPRWFRPWPFGKVAMTELCGMPVPLGDLRYRFGKLGVAVEICEEAWDSVPASAAHADAVQLILNPSASHFALGKYGKREQLVANSSRSLQALYVYTNLVGLEAGRIIYDGGVLMAEGGSIIARGERFGFTDGELVWHDVHPELASIAKLRAKPVRLEPTDPGSGTEVQGREVRGTARGGPAKSTHSPAAAGQPRPPWTPQLEFLHAQMLGLFDYLRKSHAGGYVVSLSGGCDSACCAVLVAHMIAAAGQALGLAAVAQRLGLQGGAPALTQAELLRRLLVCVYQRTQNSGAVTEAAATAVAQAIGATLHVADVEPMVAAYVKTTEALLGRKLTWERDDVTLQNIQARARAPLAWMLANAGQAILITTSNRSEAAVGYATMDGDTAGGLAPLAGIDKHFLREWLVWAESKCDIGLGPLPALRQVNVQQPTAELRPAAAGQKDEDDLMPYHVLERIERYLIRDRLGPNDILQSLTYDFPKENPATLRSHLGKFLRLWASSQWKRERFAPGFHIDDESLDPKTWCRFPILSAPYQLDP